MQSCEVRISLKEGNDNRMPAKLGVKNHYCEEFVQIGNLPRQERGSSEAKPELRFSHRIFETPLLKPLAYEYDVGLVPGRKKGQASAVEEVDKIGVYADRYDRHLANVSFQSSAVFASSSGVSSGR